MSAKFLFDLVVGVVAIFSFVVAIISFALYLRELCKRKSQETLMLGFLKGIKPIIESMATTGTIAAGAVWQNLLTQVHDMMDYLKK
jgi:hypothetical protein